MTNEQLEALKKDLSKDFFDDTCMRCGHAHESHSGLTGKCFRCNAERRCPGFVKIPREE